MDEFCEIEMRSGKLVRGLDLFGKPEDRHFVNFIKKY